MISTLSEIIAPVFFVVAAGYIIAFFKFITQKEISGLMWFAQSIALPSLLFINVTKLDLNTVFNWNLLLSFYGSATFCFLLGFIGAITLFASSTSNAISIGFCALFSNSVLLGLPITEQAYGPEELSANFAIVALHAPFCYLIGITLMELTKMEHGQLLIIPIKVMKSVLSNALTVAIILAFFFNFIKFQIPIIAMKSLDLLAYAGLPVALFGLGSILTRYKLSNSIWEAVMISAISLIIHPLMTFYAGTTFLVLTQSELRSAVITAAMAPGVNTFLFANIYQKSQDIAANTILISTFLSVFTASVWLAILSY